MTCTKLAFVDTETTGLDPRSHDVWEIAIITATHAASHECGDHELVVQEQWSAQVYPLRLRTADPTALRISGYYDRIADLPLAQATAATEVAQRTAGRHIVGAVPSFDTERLERMLRHNDLAPAWHYHLIDVEALAAGYLAALARQATLQGREIGEYDPDDEVQQAFYAESRQLHDLAAPPYRSDDLAEAVGVTVTDDDRHTALGDARWAMRTYAAVYGLDITGVDDDR